MRPPVIVEVEVTFQRRPQVAATGEVAGIDQFVFQRVPEPFDENISGLPRPKAASSAVRQNLVSMVLDSPS